MTFQSRKEKAWDKIPDWFFLLFFFLVLYSVSMACIYITP